MSEPDCPNLSEPEIVQKSGQPEPDPDLNSDMTGCPNLKFGHKFSDHTWIFPSPTNSDNRVGQIFTSPSFSPL